MITPQRLVSTKVIQGGMGAGVSHWFLASTVSKAGQLGVVSGTALDVILVRRLQDGDPGGHMRRALAAFPDQQIAQRIVDTYYIEGGRGPDRPYKNTASLNASPGRPALELIMVANFAEVYLAKEGHDGLVGINYLEKIQMATLCSLYGAMLAGVDCVLMGAGIPVQIPGILDKLAQHAPVSMRLNVEGALPEDDFRVHFTPNDVLPNASGELRRPWFLPIISSVVLGMALLKKASGKVDGFIVEGPTAGGHNAPPRDSSARSAQGEPVYGPKDRVDLERIRQLGLPFWLAGSYAHPERLSQARAAGACGVQIGTAFALCHDSGLEPSIRSAILADIASGKAEVFTDPLASPTGFPFKVIRVEGSNSQHELYVSRKRVCDLGYLRTPYRREDGSLGYRCPAEPVNEHVAKGGSEENTHGRRCLCNALLANIGLAQIQKDHSLERALVTGGEDLTGVKSLIDAHGTDYTAQHVLDFVLSDQ